jgi:hypothetical protein
LRKEHRSQQHGNGSGHKKDRKVLAAAGEVSFGHSEWMHAPTHLAADDDHHVEVSASGAILHRRRLFMDPEDDDESSLARYALDPDA